MNNATVTGEIYNTDKLGPGAILSPDRKYRYALWRRWAKGKAMLVIGLNPSTADEKENDPTITRLIAFAKRDGFGALLMGNLFAFRATDPKMLIQEEWPVGYFNTLYLREMHQEAEQTVAAWGAKGAFRRQDQIVLELLKGPIYCFGKTNSKQPKHPLYLKKTTKLVAYRHG